jgi:RND family efflux transporter MFP subunit
MREILMSSRPEPEARHAPSPRLKAVGAVCALGLVAIVVVGLVTRAWDSQKLADWTRDQAIPTVEIIRPTVGSGAQTLVLPGDVQAFYNASIHARVSGYLKRWYVDIGARVKAGQLLAEIDTPELDQQLARAQADLATAEANRRLAATTSERWAALLAKDAVSRQEAEEKAGDLAAKTSLVNAARAEVERLRAEEAFKRIVAPFDGVVTARSTDIGALIAAGAPNDSGLFTVSDVHRLRVYVRAPQNYAAQIEPGLVALLTVPEYPGRSFAATLSTTADAVGEQSGALLVELQTDNEQGLLKPGDYAQVQFSLPAPAGLTSVPASATIFRKSGLAVATVDSRNHIVMKPITVRSDLGATVEVAAGLSPGDRIVDNPPDSLADGDLVRIAGASARRLPGARPEA